MPNDINSKQSLIALVAGHISGLIFLVCLPLWITALTTGYSYSPSQAGLLPTTFLVGAVITSLITSIKFSAISSRLLAPSCFAISAVAFYVIKQTPDYFTLLILHFIAGASLGIGISIVHGTMGGTQNAHKTFAIAGFGLGVGSIAILAIVPQLTATIGYGSFFLCFSILCTFTSVVMFIFMPTPSRKVIAKRPSSSMPLTVYFAILGLIGMGFIQNMVFSFLVEVGYARAFYPISIERMLIALGVINLFPPIFAALLQTRFSALRVAKIGCVLMGLIGVCIFTATNFWVYAIPACCFVGVMIFCHTFIFGFMAKHDASGRSVSATPAILMAGAALAPIVAGLLVEHLGYHAIAYACIALIVFCLAMFTLASHYLEYSQSSTSTHIPQQ